MMRRHNLGVLLCFALLFFPLSIAQASIRLSLEPDIRKLFGHTTYHISFAGIDKFNRVVYGDSELEFPLDVWVAEAKGTLGFDVFKNREIFISGNLRCFLSDPGNKMKDSDWKTIPSIGLYDFMFSYSESEAEMNGTDFDIAGGIVFLKKSYGDLFVSLGGKIGYRRQRFDYDIIGIAYLWKDKESGPVSSYDLYEDQKVLEYEITYRIPYLGLDAEVELPVRLRIAADLAFSPLVKAKDRDDHLLRNKEATSECGGVAFLFGVKSYYVLFKSKLIDEFFLSLGSDFMYIYTIGEQDQHFYGDDPGTSDDETGIKIEGISNRIFSSQFGVMFSVGARF